MNLQHLEALVRVIDAGSFSTVARELGTTQPTISRLIAGLESHLGTQLLNRSIPVTPTDDGQRFYDLAKQALDAVSEATNRIVRRRGTPGGRLRMGCASALGRLHLAARLPEFLERYPDIGVELVLGNVFTDLTAAGLDLAVRYGGDISDTSLVMRRIGTAGLISVASHDYLERRGTPLTPADLVQHDCVVQVGVTATKQWVFERNDETTAVDVRGRFSSNDDEVVRASVLSGMGITVGTEWLYTEAMELGRVRTLLPDYRLPSIPIHVAYSSRRQVSSSMRAMIAFLVDEFSDFPQRDSCGLLLGMPRPGVDGS